MPPRSRRPAPRIERYTPNKPQDADKNLSVNDIMGEANALPERVTGGKPLPPQFLQSVDELEELGYVCDESGCVLVLPGRDDESDGAYGQSQRAGANSLRPATFSRLAPRNRNRATLCLL